MTLFFARYNEEYARFEDYEKSEEEFGCISCYRQQKKDEVCILLQVYFFQNFTNKKFHGFTED